MVDLKICKRDNEVSRYSFDSGSVTIGRGPENEIHLNSPSVCPQHARLSIVAGSCSIENLTANSSTFVNNLEVNRAQLYNKDVIRIGHYSITFCMDDEEEQSDTPARPKTTADANAKPKITSGKDNHQQTPPPNTASASFQRDTDAPAKGLYKRDATPTEAESLPMAVKQFAAAPQGERSTTLGAQAQTGDQPDEADLGTDGRAPARASASENNLPPLHGSGIDVLSGPAEGKRIYFTRDRAALGIKDVTAVLIKSAQDGYVALAPNTDINVTLNGDLITESPVPLDSGDLIAFGNLKARFFIDDPSD